MSPDTSRSFTTAIHLSLLLLVGAASGGCPATSPHTRTDGTGSSGTTGPLHDDGLLCAGPDADPRCAPEGTHEAVELRHHLAGCEAGLRGPVTFWYMGEALATLAPGESKTFRLPRGDIEIAITTGSATPPTDAPDVRSFGLFGSGPVKVEVGCAPTAFLDAGLMPLVVRGPRASPGPNGTSCPAARIRAGGLDFQVGPSQVRTLFLPVGEHIVRIDGQSQTVRVGAEGASVSAPGCASQGRGQHGSVSARDQAGPGTR